MRESDKQGLWQVIVDIAIAAPIDQVWEAVRDPSEIGNWFGWDSETLPGEIDFIFVSNVVADDAAYAIRFAEWETVSHRLELTEHGGKTRLRLVSSGAPEIDWSGAYEEIAEGWITFFEQLRMALERHPGERRRTLYLSGAARPGIGDPSATLGLAEASAGQPGASYSVRLATGETASGRIWHKTHFQTGLTVSEWGEGLLVVTDKDVSDERPHGGGAVILTTYGLSDAEFAALEARWKEWWDARYRPINA